MTTTHCRECGKELTQADNQEPDVCNACYALMPSPIDMFMPETDEFKKLLKDARDAARVTLEIQIAGIAGLERGTLTYERVVEANSKAHRDQQAALAAIGSFILGWIGDDM